MVTLLDNQMSTAQLELSVCDEDLRKHFGATKEHEEKVYVPGLPTKIQLNRYLKVLIKLMIDNNTPKEFDKDRYDEIVKTLTN